MYDTTQIYKKYLAFLSKSILLFEMCIRDRYKYSLNETRELLDAVENWYKRRYDVTLADDEIMAVCGSQEGLAPVSYTHLDVYKRQGEGGLLDIN